MYGPSAPSHGARRDSRIGNPHGADLPIRLSEINAAAAHPMQTLAMQIPLHITFRNLPRSESVEARIREKAARLEEFHPRITGCHVTVEELDRHRRQGKQVRIRLSPAHLR